MVTAAEDREVCYAALELGASDFLLRPIDPREFTRRIGNVLALEAERREMANLLQREAQAARLHARRLDMIWRAGAASVDDTFLRNLIDAASRGLVEGRHFAGAIARLDGDEFVIDFANDAPDGAGYVTVGHRFPTANHREAIDANTIEGVQDIPPERRARANWRSSLCSVPGRPDALLSRRSSAARASARVVSRRCGPQKKNGFANWDFPVRSIRHDLPG